MKNKVFNKMKEYIYVLREDMYHEWAMENGATNLISVSYDIDTILKDLKYYLSLEKQENNARIIGDDIENQDINKIASDINLDSGVCYINIYENDNCYSNGIESSCFVIERMEVK